jgi:regulator of RNase E activity RraA
MDDSLTCLIREKPPLVEDGYPARARKLASSLLSDALRAPCAMDYGIKPLASGMRIVGTAMTVTLQPGDNLFLHKAIYLSGKGYVLVVDGKGFANGAVWGEMTTRAAMASGTEGIVLDGFIRDLSEIRELGLPVFARGTVPGGVNRMGPGGINTIISCGGIAVHPGDLVMGDEDGVVVIPRNRIADTILQAEKMAAQEQFRIREIAQGKLEPEWLKQKFE